MVDFDFFEYRYQQRTAASYENYIYQAIEGFELDEIVPVSYTHLTLPTTPYV